MGGPCKVEERGINTALVFQKRDRERERELSHKLKHLSCRCGLKLKNQGEEKRDVDEEQ